MVRPDASRSALNFVIDGGGSAITTGVKGDLHFPESLTITGWRLYADQSGSIVIDLWKDRPDKFPPTNAKSICASAKPTLSSQAFASSQTLTGWTVSVVPTDVVRVNVDSATTVTRVTLVLEYD